MHPEQIKATMRAKGISLAALADELDVTASVVSQVVSGRSVSARIQSRIAEIADIPVEVLWPSPKVRNPLYRRKGAVHG